MIVYQFPNSEIEVFLSHRSICPRVDSGRVRPPLTYGSLVRQESESCLKPAPKKGWGTLHEGQSKPRRGTRKRVVRLGGALDRVAVDRQLERCFLTLTCPGSSESAIKAFSAWSGKILHSLHNWISKKVLRFSGVSEVARIHVWELQSRGAEHLHAVYAVPSEVFYQIKREIRSWYFDLLTRLSLENGTDFFERSSGLGSWRERPDVLQLKVEKVVKTVGAYLSKYLGKDLSGEFKGFRSMKSPRPARLWGCSNFLRESLRQFSQSVYFDLDMRDRDVVFSRVMELATERRILCYVESWGMGLSHRLRFFFSGNESAQALFRAEIDKIIEELTPRAPRERRVSFVTAELLRKALRITAKQAKKVGFDDLYGTAISQALANWVNEVPQDRFTFEIMLRSVEDFDEVNFRSLGIIVPGSLGKKKTPQQLALEFYPKK